MKARFHTLLISYFFSLPFCTQLFAATVYLPSGIYDGDSLGRPFPYTDMSDPDGTTAFPLGNLYLQELDNSALALPLSCFGNARGSLTVYGRGFDIKFTNIRTATNGSALSNTSEVGEKEDLVKNRFVIGNFGSIQFINCESLSYQDNNVTNSSHGTVYSVANVILGRIDKLQFIKNNVSGSGGGIYCPSLTIHEMGKECLFEYNMAATNGGAIAVTSDFSAVNNSIPLVFHLNSAAGLGGAICAKGPVVYAVTTKTATNRTVAVTKEQNNVSMNLAGNSSLQFIGNSAGSGGAIYAEGNISFLENAIAVFENNSASPEGLGLGNGGALCSVEMTPNSTSTTTTQTGGNTETNKLADSQTAYEGISFVHQGSLLFAKNFAANSGGAIYTKSLSIEESGSVIFISNMCYDSGGAIYIANGGTLGLSADYGDIIFTQNISGKDGKRNSITLADGAKCTKLSAAAGRQIVFYDPILGFAPSTAFDDTGKLVINGEPSDAGSVIFSGIGEDRTAMLPRNYVTASDNSHSVIYQPVTLVAGSLVLRHGAVLEVGSFTQEDGAILLMDGGTKLSMTSKKSADPTAPGGGGGVTAAVDNDGTLKITGLHINLTTALEGAPVEIAAATSGTVDISGAISLDDLYESVYENHDILNQSNLTIPIVKLSGKTVTKDNLSLEPIGDVVSGYGYQGSWSFDWDGGGTTLNATWTKSGYLPGPERIATLVPDSLWGTIIDVRSVTHLASSSCEGPRYCKGLWGAGVSNYFYHDRDIMSHGFRHISGGYVVGANTQIRGTVFGLAFGELFGRSKDYVVANSKTHTCIGSIYASTRTPICNPRVHFGTAAQVSYGRSTQHLKTHYSFGLTKEGRWDNNCYFAELDANLPITLCLTKLCLRECTPFVRAQLVYADHEAFEEGFRDSRNFSRGHLINLSVPVGLKFEKRTLGKPNYVSLSACYACDAYRCNEGTKTTLIANGVNWKTRATNLERSAALVEGSAHSAINCNWEFFGGGSFEWRMSSRSYHANLGTQFRF